MGSKRAVLWGIDGELRGNEGRIMSSLPFVSVGKRIAAARSFDWSLEHEQGLRWFSSEAEAKEAGTHLRLKKRIDIGPGECVVTLGPEFFQNAQRIAGEQLNLLNSFVRTVEGFRVSCLTLPNYEILGQVLALRARMAFDHAVTSNSGKRLDYQARAALSAMRGNGFTRLEDLVVRRLIAARITKDADAYRIAKELAVIRLKEPEEKVERLVEDHFRILTEKAPFERNLPVREIHGRVGTRSSKRSAFKKETVYVTVKATPEILRVKIVQASTPSLPWKRFNFAQGERYYPLVHESRAVRVRSEQYRKIKLVKGLESGEGTG